MLVDIMNEQCKTDQVQLLIINNFYNSELLLKIDSRVRIYCLDRVPGSLDIINIIRLNAIVYRARPDIMHFHDHNGIRTTLLRGHAKTLLTAHGLQCPTKHLKSYDKLISISKAVQDDLSGRGYQSLLIYNGVNFSKIVAKKSFHFQDKFRLVQVSRLHHEIKGQDVLLKAVHNLVYEKNIKNLQLDFIGEGPSMNYLLGLTKQLSLEGYVNFVGLKDRNFICQNLAKYDLLVQPSLNEGFGLTIIEAMGARIPAIVSNIKGPMEVINNGQHGFHFNTGDPNSCANTIANVLERLPNLYSDDFIDSAYNYAVSNFSLTTTCFAYLECYKQSISQN